MPYDDYHNLRFERCQHGVLLITIDRPEKLNATDERLHSELAGVWREVARDPDAEAVVVTGAGRAFSAGGDLEMVERMSGDYRRVAAMAGEAAELVLGMIDCQVPIISAINGTAVGAGLAVALMADISVIGESVRLTDGHLRLGVGRVLDEALEIAGRIAAGPRQAARWTKRTLNHWLRVAVPAFDAGVAYEMLSFLGEDVREGASALRERREPRFED
ncbi:MAG: enoyl-CoA hydratase [Actinobacteria bacterium]|nr:MAG: enoyl-CoA hydratase [Actinomycetota bacterium]